MKITFLIGNGFDIALSKGLGLCGTDSKAPAVGGTSYKNLYSWLNFFDITSNELADNLLAREIYNPQTMALWKDFESGLVKYYENIECHEDLLKFFKDFDQLHGFICAALTIANNEIRAGLYEIVQDDPCLPSNIEREFCESVTGFLNRMSVIDRKRIESFISDRSKDHKIKIDCICFNGTDTFGCLYDIISRDEKKFIIDNKGYDIEFESVKYVHSRLMQRMGSYERFAFGTTGLINTGCKTWPDSINNILKKTNYSFDDWTDDTDLFVSCGISYGECDIYYWQIILDCLRKDLPSMLISFPYVSKGDLCHLEDIKNAEKRKILSHSCYSHEAADRLIVSYDSLVNPIGDSSCIFSF